MRTHKCDKCKTEFFDDITLDDHSRGSPEQEIVIDDVPWLCVTCNGNLVVSI